MPKHWLILGVVALFGSMGLDAQAAGSAAPYEINVLLDQTGTMAFTGAKQAVAINVLEDVVNESGGIRGRPVRFVFHDTASNPQIGVQLTNQLIAQNVPVILGPTLSASCSAIFPMIEKTGPVEWCYSPVVRPPPGSYAFMGAPAIQDVQPVLLRFFSSRNQRNVALITSTDASGQNFEQKFDVTMSRPEFRSMTIVAREHFNPSDLTVAAQIARIKAAHPDVIITYTSGTPFGTVLRAIAEAGLTTLPVYGSGANMNVDQIEQYRSFLPDELYINAAEGVKQDPHAAPEVKRRQATFFAAMKKAGVPVEYSGSLSWDPTLAVVEAIRTLGPDATAAQLHDYLEHLKDWPGIQGVYDFSTGDQRGLGEGGAALYRWNKDQRDWDLVATGQMSR
jgi:branched-chain amino acid transport system substrate-binding protein